MSTKSIRVEHALREIVNKVQYETDRNIQESTEYLIRLGLDAKEAGKDPVIEGPFGISRPFSKLKIGSNQGTTELRIRRSKVDIDKAAELFGERTDTENLRQALRLGAITEFSDDVGVEGPGGFTRIFADVDLE